MLTHQPFFIPSVLFLLLSLPLILKLIPRQMWYGVRTSKTLSNDRIWYQANAFAGRVLLISSILYLGVAQLIPCTTTTSTDFSLWLLHLAAFGLPLLISMFLIRGYINSLS